jgi:hypothetical protein
MGAPERRPVRRTFRPCLIAREALEMPTLPDDFDGLLYLQIHPDVKALGIDPAQHYLTYGIKEGRRYNYRIEDALLPKVIGRYDYDGLLTVHNHDFMHDATFLKAYARGVSAAGADPRWYWRVHIGLWAAESAARVQGDFVECGVNRGFLSSAIMSHLDWDQTGRMFYLLDTFSGLDEKYVSGKEKSGGVLKKNQELLQIGIYTTDLDAVKRNFAEWRNCKIVVGSIPDTLVHIESEKIAFLHIDLNCTIPEVAAIDALWDRLAPGAFVLLDDYAYYGFQPQKEGMDAWAARRKVPIASLPSGQGLIVKI